MSDAPTTAGKAHSPDLRSFGRKRGRKISARQESLMRDALPRLRLDLASPAPDDLYSLFATPVRELWLEIGFGGAEHMIWQATHNSDAGIIGCEPFEEGMVKALTAIEGGELRNIRLHADDARQVLKWLPARTLSRAFILFPDPWLKKRHRKRRLVSRTLLESLARVMKPGAELRLATDIGDYACAALLFVRQCPAFRWEASCADDWRARDADWPETRYERKAINEGRKPYFLRFIRR